MVKSKNQVFYLPYGRKKIEFKTRAEVNLCESQLDQYKTNKTQEELVLNALKNPIDSPPLSELTRFKKTITIVTSDHTRPMPSQITLPLLIAECRKFNKNLKIQLLIATGTHRAPTETELKTRFGTDVLASTEVIIHDATQKKEMVDLRKSNSARPLLINKSAVATDLLIAEGFIEPHLFAGFSGGAKSVFPGVADLDSIMANHCGEYIADSNSRPGLIMNNLIYQDICQGGKEANLAYILNVVLDGEKKIINAFSGAFEKAHQQGCFFLQKHSTVKVEKADIVITTNGGYPLDQNIYQAVKSMRTAARACKKGGVIICLSECSDGHGAADFYQAFCEYSDLQELQKDILSRNYNQTQKDQWQVQILVDILLKHHVILVSAVATEIVEQFQLVAAANLTIALSKAQQILNNHKPLINVIPHGTGVIIDDSV